MAIFSLIQDQNTGVAQQRRLPEHGRAIEPANFAFITKSGIPHGAATRSTRPTAPFTPNPATDLFMGSGDQLNVDIHDGAAGLPDRPRPDDGPDRAR